MKIVVLKILKNLQAIKNISIKVNNKFTSFPCNKHRTKVLEKDMKLVHSKEGRIDRLKKPCLWLRSKNK